MLRFLLRRDRVLLPSWVMLIAGVVLTVTGQYSRMFPTPESAYSFAADLAGNAALTAFTGQLTEPTLHGQQRRANLRPRRDLRGPLCDVGGANGRGHVALA